MKYILKNNLYFLIFVSTIHFLYRILIYSIYLSENKFFFSENYLLALSNENFLDYLLFHHSIPIGNIFLSKLILIFSGGDNLYLIYYILNTTYTCSVLIVFSKIYNLLFNKNSLILIFILFAISFSFLSYDTWRVHHYDHILILFFSLLSLYMAEIFLKSKKFIFGIKFVFLMSLIAIFSNLFIVIYLILSIFLIIYKKNLNISISSFFYSTIVIFLVFSSVLIKNKFSINEITPTSIKGWNFIQRPLYTLGYDKYFDLYLNKLDLSKTNQICVLDIKDRKQNLVDDELFTSLVLHKCFFDFEKKIYDFSKLKKVLKDNKITNYNLNLAIELDIKDLKNNQWKFSGGHEDINLRTTVFFHKEAIKVYLSSFIYYPFEMLIGTPKTEDNQGVLFTFLNMFRWGSQLPYYYETQHKNFNNKFFVNFQIIFSGFILAGLILSFINSIFFLKNFFYNNNFSIKELNKYALIFLILLICLGYNLTTSLITCCENQRNAVMIFPFLIIISFTSLLIGIKKLKKIL